jgi:hypothetical protein
MANAAAAVGKICRPCVRAWLSILIWTEDWRLSSIANEREFFLREQMDASAAGMRDDVTAIGIHLQELEVQRSLHASSRAALIAQRNLT